MDTALWYYLKQRREKMTTESKESADQFYKRTVFELCDLLHCYPSILVDTIKESHSAFTAPVSPLPLWGKLPEIKRYLKGFRVHYLIEKGEDAFLMTTTLFPTEAEAILAWNRIAEALNEVER